MSKKRKDIPFHIVHNFNKYKLSDGTVFWAKDDEDAKLYINKVEKK